MNPFALLAIAVARIAYDTLCFCIGLVVLPFVGIASLIVAVVKVAKS